jgi:hypothetical protein
MKLYNLNEVEIKRILELHSKEKSRNLINEQASRDQLEMLQKKDCIKNGTVVQIKTKLTSETFAIRQISSKDPNKKRYFLNTGEVLEYDGSKLKKLNGKWDVTGCKNKEIKQVITTGEEQEIKDGGWMTYDEAKKANLDFTTGMYEQKIFGGVTYYRKTGKIIGGAGSKEKQEVIDFIEERFGTRFNRSVDDSSTAKNFCWAFQREEPRIEPRWQLENVPGAEEYGMKNLQIHVNPSCLKKIREKTKNVVSTEIGAREVDNDTCKDTIEKYFNAYRTGIDTQSTAFLEMKDTVMSCQRKFCSLDTEKTQGRCEGRWKLGLFGGSRKIDDVIDFFTGQSSKLGTNPPAKSPFRFPPL